MKKAVFRSIFVVAVLLLFVQSVSLEARAHHHHRSTRVEVGIGAGAGIRDAYVARRYVRPVVQPVYVMPTHYPAPAYIYTAPVYVEDVYVARPVCSPFSFGGLSLSWNFFK